MRINHKSRLVVLLGPTASGKTTLGIGLAQWHNTEVISADSRQVYREMNIGTAKPSPQQLQMVTHHLIGHVSVTETYNAGRFEKEALAILSRLFITRPFALLVGGTGLYINAICHGLDELPESDPGLRQKLKELYHAHGIGYLQEELLRSDPDYFQVVDIHNPARLMRALEVSMVTGRPYSSFRKGHIAMRNFEIVKIGLEIPREELIRRINHRVDHMMQEGLLEEVISLLPFRAANALNTVGYTELFDYLDGKSSLEEAVEKIKINTRRYAKRQMTWFRKDKEIAWFDPMEEDSILEYISTKL